ncbi:MAG: pantoate--beta-alanine ligase [Flavobacterium sp.]|jgi:pantoate--beta-alanine ligase
MQVFTSNSSLNNYLAHFRAKNCTIGFVPTMGALHDGHLSLMQNSILENTFTVVSIFVNPTQFNNPEDLKKYPRNLDADLEKIEGLSNKFLVYAPTVTDIYGDKVSSQNFKFGGLEHQMEGKFRPGHFDGVGTVVKALFEIVKPNKAYFGEKDFQQLQIIKKLVALKNLPIEIVECPIFREQNGLAMSSRNERLSKSERESAAIIFQTLHQVKEYFTSKSVAFLKEMVKNTFDSQPEIELEYFEIANVKNLKSVQRKNKNQEYRAFIAVVVNGIRLIDTISL